jgi:hypothetical protein
MRHNMLEMMAANEVFLLEGLGENLGVRSRPYQG